MSKILFVDPGTRKLGYSVFRDTGGSGDVRLVRSGVIVVGKKTKWVGRVDVMVRKVLVLLQPSGKRGRRERVSDVRIVIEMPRVWGGAVGGRGEGARNSGAIGKLLFLIGALRQMLQERGYGVELIGVEKWKGNVPKSVTVRRVVKRWGYVARDGELEKGSDEADAVGMGDWWFRKGPGVGHKIVRRHANSD